MFRILTILCLLAAPLSATAGEPKSHSADKPFVPPEGWTTELHLITIGPAEHAFTRFGHTALMAISRKEGTKEYISKVYNYGDANFKALDFEWRFFRGTAQFYISALGTLNQTVTRYARENRNMTHQKLSLPEAQVRKLIKVLEENLKPANREYTYHHLTAGCATKVRDRLDDLLQGALARTLKPQQDPLSPRYYGRQVFAGHLLMEVFSDLFMGRLHDKTWSKYEAACVPHVLSTYLQEIQVPDPKDSNKLVPLAGPAKHLYRRRGPPPTAGEGRTLIHLSFVWITLILGLGIFALLGQPHQPKRAGAWLMVWALPMGIASVCMLIGLTVSTVIEGRINELMMVYPPTDILLIGVAWRWLRGRGVAGKLLRNYAMVRLLLVCLNLALHAAGVFHQEPLVLVIMGAVAAAFLLVITRRFPQGFEEAQTLSR